MAVAQASSLTVQVQLHPAQQRFLHSLALFKAFCGGIGSGKSWCLAYDLIRRARPGRLYVMIAPTYSMLADATFRSFLSVARMLGVVEDKDIKRGAPPSVRLRTGSEVLFRSADEANHLRGPNVSGVALDEASLMEKEVFDICIGRLREGGEQGWLTAAFTPKGKKHWTYQVFGLGRPDTALIRATTRDNPFLPPTFAETVGAQYTSIQARQELEGEFVDTEGGLFKRTWFDQVVDVVPPGCSWARYWDKAATENAGCFTCGVLMGRGCGLYFVDDVIRGQWSTLERDRIIEAAAHRDRKRYGVSVQTWVEQEPGSGGKESAEATIRQLAGFVVRADRPTGDKRARAEPYAAQCEAGNVRLTRAAWNQSYVEELCLFPNCGFADQVDASSGAFNKLALGRSWLDPDRRLVLYPETRDANGQPLELGPHGRPPGTGIEWHFSAEASRQEFLRINAEMEREEDMADAWGHPLIDRR
jgi:predicted phage terminase large subunit-like protein